MLMPKEHFIDTFVAAGMAARLGHAPANQAGIEKFVASIPGDIDGLNIVAEFVWNSQRVYKIKNPS